MTIPVSGISLLVVNITLTIELHVFPSFPVQQGRFVIYLCTYELCSGPPEAPTQVHVNFVTAISSTLYWKSRLNGGHPQTFYILIRPGESTSFFQSQPDQPIPDPGFDSIMTHTVTDLSPNTQMQFQVWAKNMYGIEGSPVVDARTLRKYHLHWLASINNSVFST